MFTKLKYAMEQKKKEAAELRAYEKSLRESSAARIKEQEMANKKKALEEKYTKLQTKYSKSPAERRAEIAKKAKQAYSNFNTGKGDDIWSNLGKWSEKSENSLLGKSLAPVKRKPMAYGSSGRKPVRYVEKMKPVSQLDKFMRGDFK